MCMTPSLFILVIKYNNNTQFTRQQGKPKTKTNFFTFEPCIIRHKKQFFFFLKPLATTTINHHNTGLDFSFTSLNDQNAKNKKFGTLKQQTTPKLKGTHKQNMYHAFYNLHRITQSKQMM